MQSTWKSQRCCELPQSIYIAELIGELGNRDGMERQQARTALVRLGKPAIKPLIAALSNERTIVRWEAAKAFTELQTPSAAPALVKLLDDEDGGVRWLAAEALISLGEPALTPLFEILINSKDSSELRAGAHHVLRALNEGDLAEIVEPVLSSLDMYYEPELAVPLSAETALEKLSLRKA